nr:specifically androgen-regulated gene protein isoform X2 [Geotrypetes seraphini]XP_033774503.1 specifically androgen-regulated gene protein isoform X2 [Geotrypetes seraphini]XP_033774504.1 specifically androgen-regulated gene protein isoform X2 [Geotrypetes seraphini]
MPESELWTGNCGMESMSSGSCDSVVSITSNHSAFSDECYDHLSAEERECLMFLEETIDSLDVEVDSRVSTDESERVDEASKEHETSYVKPTLPKEHETSYVKPTLPKEHEISYVKPTLPKEHETSYVKPTLPKSPCDTLPKSLGQQVAEAKSNAPKPDLLNAGPVLIPNSGFRSLPRNVLAPREESTLSVSRNIAASCIDVSTACNEGSRGTLSEWPLEDRQRKGSLQNLLHIPPPEPFRDENLALDQAPVKTNLTEVTSEDSKVIEVDDTVVKGGCEKLEKMEELVPLQQFSPGSEVISEQNKQDVPGLQQPQNVQCEKSSDVQKVIQETPHGYREKFESQECLNLSTAKAADLHFKQGPPIAPKPRKLPPNIILKRSDGSLLNSSAESEPRTRTSSLSRNIDAFHVKPFDSREQGKARQEALMKLGLKAKPEVLSTSPLKSPGFLKSGEFTMPKTSMENTTNERSPKNAQPGTIQNVGLHEEVHVLSTNPEKSLVSPKSKEIVVPKANMENLVKHGGKDMSTDKRVITNPVAPQEKTQILSTSPVQSSGFPKPREVSKLKEEMTRDGKAETADKRSSYAEPGAGLRLPEGSLPGLRHFSFKSNTLERSGIGLSSYVDNSDQSQKSSGSVFKNAISSKFSSSFLRNSRPRPASLGTGKDFSNLQSPDQAMAEPEKNENRRSFPLQNLSKPSRPGVSVKITPKGSSNEEHRREALIKLGLLK